MGFGNVGGVVIEPLKFVDLLAEVADPGQQGIGIVVENGDGVLGGLEQLGGVGGSLVFGFECFLPVRFELGALDLPYLEAEQVELLGVGLFIDDEGGLCGFQRRAPGEQAAEIGDRCLDTGEGVQQGELTGRMKQRLMIMRAVHVDQPIADSRQSVQGRRAQGPVHPTARRAGP